MKLLDEWLDERAPPKSKAVDLLLTIATLPIWAPLIAGLWIYYHWIDWRRSKTNRIKPQ